MTDWLRAFRKPSAEHTACPFWFWNGALEPDELLRQLELMHDKGIRAFVIHPRAGLSVEYLSPPWFDRCRLVIDEAARRGMKVWIYDEENWPSGYAGGRVVRRDVRFRGQNLVAERHYVDGPGVLSLELERPDEVHAVVALRIIEVTPRPPQPLLLFPKPPSTDWRDIQCFEHRFAPDVPRRLSIEGGGVRWDIPQGRWCLMVFRQQPTEWYGCYSQHPYVDLMNEQAVRAFIDETHEQYHAAFRTHFGDTILGFFIDEPACYNNFWDRNPGSVPFTHDFAAEFERRRGYDLFSWAAALWVDLGRTTEGLRVDFWRTVSELLAERCFQQIADWCTERGVRLTGHLEWEEWIYTSVRHGGSPFYALGALQVPGVDKIDEITDKISEKLVASIAHAHRRPRVLSETFALTGWKLAPPYMKRIVDQQYVRGVNWLSCHGFYYSTEDWRKFECPPSEFFQNPWWEHSQPLWEYVARLSAALSSGRHVAPVALYYPLEHAWATMTPDAPPACDGTIWERWQLPQPEHPTQRADLSMQRVARQLLEGQYDFDLVDHALLHGAAVADGQLSIGDERFGALVIPALDVIDSRAMQLALALAEAGGTVVFINNLPQRAVDGDLPAQWGPLRATLAAQQRPFVLPVGSGWIGYVPQGEFAVRALLGRCVRPDVEIVPTPAARRRYEHAHAQIHRRGTRFPAAAEALRYHAREVDDGRLYFIFNESGHPLETTLRLRGGPAVVEYEVRTGAATMLPSQAAEGDMRELVLTWEPWQSRLLHVGHAEAPSPLREDVAAQWPLESWHLAFDGERLDGSLSSWHELGWPQHSGRAMYETTFTLGELRSGARYEIDLGQVFETARLWLNDQLVGDRAWSPYVFDISDVVRAGVNRLRVAVANTNANAFENAERVSGLLGPVFVKVLVKA